MSLEVRCPHCNAALLAEPGRCSCYACGQVMEVEAPLEARRLLAEPVVRFLRGLLFDGELSGDEVWCLANWLNKQPREVSNAWPANVLIPLLQNVFADGELSNLEMMRIATTLVQIEQEWTTHYAAVEEPIEAASPVVVSEALTRPLLPVVSYIGNVESSTSDGQYRVDLANHSCTCADWVGVRRSAPPQNFKRLCKHMAGLFHSLEIPDQIGDKMFGAFIDDHYQRGRGTLPKDDWAIEKVNGKRVLYGHSSGSPWANVFAPIGASYERFGFNKEEKRWSYGESPAGFARFFREKFRNS